MDRIILETSDSPDVQIQDIHGSLRIKGWDRPEFRLDSDQSDTATVNQVENKITLNANSGVLLRTPMEANITIQQVQGELILKSVECQINAETILGQVMAKSIGPLSVDAIHGNLSARNIEGSLVCKKINGMVSLQDVEGKIKLDEVKGNLVIKGYTSGIVASTRGNATLRLEPEPENEYRVEARGNINCRLSPDTNATVTLKSGARQIRISSLGKKENFDVDEHTFTIGDGEGTIVLDARGRIDFTVPSPEEMDWSYEFEFQDNISAVAEDISQIVTEQIENQLDSLSIHLSALSDNLATIGPAASEKARQKLEVKRNQLERKLARLEKRTEERVRKAVDRSKTSRQRYSYTTSKASSDPVSDEERQQVLQMLADKKISVEEAEILLAALEGREPDLSTGNKE